MTGWFTFCLICCFVTDLSKAQFDSFLIYDPDTVTDEKTVVEKLALLQVRAKNLTEEAVRVIFPIVTDLMITSNISRSCLRDCSKLFLGFRKLKTWAVKFLDASTKSIDGLLDVNTASLGSYDECVDNKVYFGRSGKLMFQGKYCNINIKPYLKRDSEGSLFGSKNTGIPKNAYREDSIFGEIAKLLGFAYSFAIEGGLCVPSGCSTEDVNAILRTVSDYMGISVKAVRCAVKEEKKFTPLVIGVISLYCFVGLLVLVGTIVDIYSAYFKKHLGSTLFDVLKSFSFVSNFKKLTDTSTSLKTDCLNGMRFLSLTWVILGHGYMIFATINISYPSNFEDYVKDYAFQVIVNATSSVTTFFFLSGFLVCYVTTNLVRIQKKPFYMHLYVIHRLWRLLPAYIFVICYEFIKPLTGSGPMFYKASSVYTEYCEKHWWTNLLFINNFYKQNEMCLPHTWFTAVEFQLYIFALVVLLPLMRWPKVGICMASAIIITSIATTLFLCYKHNVITTFILTLKKEEMDYFHQYHNMNLYLHLPAFFIGLILGYFLAIRSDYKVPKAILILGWTTSIASCLAVIYGVQKWNAGVKPEVLELALYMATFRTVWALGIAWMTFCCVTGHGGIVNCILSLKIWKPLGRLTYFSYLVHLTVLLSYSANMRTIIKLDHYIGVWLNVANIVVIYAVAFVGSMLIEAPFLSLEKIVFRGAAERSSLPPKESEHADTEDLERNCNRIWTEKPCGKKADEVKVHDT